MMLRTHFLFGILVSLLFLHLFPSPNAYIFISLVCLGSLVVDVDTSRSSVGRKTRPVSWFLELFFGHRGFFHSLTAAIIIFLLSIYLISLSFYAFAPALGYLSHIFLDAFTMSGVPLFKPFSDRRIQGPISTGSFAEYIILFIILFLDVYLIFGLFFTS